MFESVDSFPITLNVGNPCRKAKLDDFTIQDMIATVLGPAVQQNIGGKVPQDDISRQRGNQDGFTYCGERKFRIISTATADYLSYSDDLTTLTLLSTKDSEIGEKVPVTIQAYLVDYKSVEKTSTFFVSVRSCVVLKLSPE